MSAGTEGIHDMYQFLNFQGLNPSDRLSRVQIKDVNV